MDYSHNLTDKHKYKHKCKNKYISIVPFISSYNMDYSRKAIVLTSFVQKLFLFNLNFEIYWRSIALLVQVGAHGHNNEILDDAISAH